MTDDHYISKANESLDNDAAMSISFMREALAAYRRKVEKPLATELPKLSTRQAEAYDFIKNHIAQSGYSPSVREIADELGLLSSSTAQGILNQLFKKGYLKRIGTRAIEITGKREG